MKRLLLVIAVIGVAAAAFGSLGAAAPERVRAGQGRTGATAAAAAGGSEGAQALEIGVKCDFPPFGYIGADGKKGGYDVDVARRFAQIAFGKSTRVSMECVTTPSRIPALMSKRVDIISTLTYTLARDQQIDFSIPYYDATGRLLVRNDTNISSLGALAVRPSSRPAVRSTTAGYAIASRHEVARPRLNYVVDSGAQGQTCGHVHVRRRASARDRRQRLAVEAHVAEVPEPPVGDRDQTGETQMKAWVDAAVRLMKKNDEFATILKKNTPRRFWKEFLTNVPRPKGKRIVYPTVSDPAALCP